MLEIIQSQPAASTGSTIAIGVVVAIVVVGFVVRSARPGVKAGLEGKDGPGGTDAVALADGTLRRPRSSTRYRP